METREEKNNRVDKRQDLEKEMTDVLEEIEIEDLTVDGICGVY